MPSKKLEFILKNRSKASASCSLSRLCRHRQDGLAVYAECARALRARAIAADDAPQSPSECAAVRGWCQNGLASRVGLVVEASFRGAAGRTPSRCARSQPVGASRVALGLPSDEQESIDGDRLTHEQRHAAKANESLSISHFREWVRHARRSHPPHAADAWRFTTREGHGNEQAPGFNASQISWLVDEGGKLIVREVYRLEDLERRWPELQGHVCGLRGISYRSAYEHPAVRAMDHASRHAPFAQYYDAETSGIVGEYMAPDVRAFGYAPPVLVGATRSRRY